MDRQKVLSKFDEVGMKGLQRFIEIEQELA